MRLDWALLANAAEAPPNGLVYILGAGFDTLGLVRIRADVKPDNVASIKIFERAGFVLEGDHDGLRRYRRER